MRKTFHAGYMDDGATDATEGRFQMLAHSQHGPVHFSLLNSNDQP